MRALPLNALLRQIPIPQRSSALIMRIFIENCNLHLSYTCHTCHTLPLQPFNCAHSFTSRPRHCCHTATLCDLPQYKHNSHLNLLNRRVFHSLLFLFSHFSQKKEEKRREEAEHTKIYCFNLQFAINSRAESTQCWAPYRRTRLTHCTPIRIRSKCHS